MFLKNLWNEKNENYISVVRSGRVCWGYRLDLVSCNHYHRHIRHSQKPAHCQSLCWETFFSFLVLLKYLDTEICELVCWYCTWKNQLFHSYNLFVVFILTLVCGISVVGPLFSGCDCHWTRVLTHYLVDVLCGSFSKVVIAESCLFIFCHGCFGLLGGCWF